MHERTRSLAPILPVLVTTAEQRRDHAHRLLAAARSGAPGEAIEVDGEHLARLSIATDPAKGGTGRPGVIYATEPGGGTRRNSPSRKTTPSGHGP